MSWVHWTGLIVLAAIAAAVVASPPRATSTEADDLLRCQKGIKAIAANPSAAVIPHVKPRPVRGGHHFEWSRGSGLKMTNQFGAVMDASASCAVVDSRVAELIVNGEVHQ